MQFIMPADDDPPVFETASAGRPANPATGVASGP